MYSHPAFSRPLDALIRTLEKQQPQSYRGHLNTRLLRRILDVQEGNPPGDWDALLQEADAGAPTEPALKRTIQKEEV